MSEKPVFKLKRGATKDAMFANFRVSQQTHRKICDIARDADTNVGDILRQMIDFALEHLDETKDVEEQPHD